MIKKIWIFSLIILALFYIVSGFYFYKKSFRNKIALTIQSVVVPVTQPDLVILKEIFNDFEKKNSGDKNLISAETFFSGKKSFKITPSIEYGAEIIQSFSEIPFLNDLRQIEVSFKTRNVDVEEGTSWVLELDGEDGKVIGWYSEFLPSTINKWESCTFHFNIKTEFLNKANRIKTYVWNKNKGEFYIDDLRIRFLGVNKEINNTIFNPLFQTSFFFDLENDSSLEISETISNAVSHSGKFSSFVNGKNEYSVLIRKKFIQVMNDTISTVGASVWLYPLNDNPECTFVFEVRNSQEEQIYWNGKSTAKMNLKAKHWQKLNASFNIAPEDYRKFGADDYLCIYIFNNNNSKVYADDFEISFGAVPEQRGIRNYADMNVVEPNSYWFDRYHPPYRISSLQLENIGNGNSQFLINNDSVHLGNIKPDDFIAAGIFTGPDDGKDELLVISNNSFETFYYCNDKKCFVLSGNLFIENNKYKNSEFLTGDFDGDKKDELIITTGKLSSVFNFSADQNRNCINNPNGLHMNLIWSGNLLNENAKMLSGNFSGNTFDEILFAQPDGHYIVKKFNGKEWTLVCNDYLPQFKSGKTSSQVCGKFTSSVKDAVLFISNEKNKIRYSFLELAGQNIKIKFLPDPAPGENIFSANDVLYTVKVKDKKTDDILAFNNQWRFELKNISIGTKGLYIASVPEFTGYIADQNPKYYEFPQIVSGRFTNNKTQLLCILRNCADKNFNGKNCKDYDSIPDLPNTIQLYNFLQ